MYIHNWNDVLCRGPDTLGKEAFALGKGFAQYLTAKATLPRAASWALGKRFAEG